MDFQLNIDDETDFRTHIKKFEFSEKNNPKTMSRFNWTPSIYEKHCSNYDITLYSSSYDTVLYLIATAPVFVC